MPFLINKLHTGLEQQACFNKCGRFLLALMSQFCGCCEHWHAHPVSQPVCGPLQEALSPSPSLPRTSEESSSTPTMPPQLQLQHGIGPAAAMAAQGPAEPAGHYQQPWTPPPPPPPPAQGQQLTQGGQAAQASLQRPAMAADADTELALACVRAVAAFVAQRMADDLRSLGFEEWQAAAAVQVRETLTPNPKPYPAPW